MLASSGSSIKFWDTQNYELAHELTTISNESSAITWNKDGQYLASLDKKNSEISLYTVSSASGVCSGILRIMDQINCVQFCNTTNRYMAVGGAKDTVLIWDVKGNARKKAFVVTRAGISKLSFSAMDSHLVVGTSVGDAFLLSNTNNIVTGPVKLFTGKTKVSDIRYSLLNRSLVGASGENGGVVLLDTHASKVLKEFPAAHSAPVSSLAFSPINELLLVSVGYDKKFVSYNANSKSVVMTHHMSAPLTSVCFLRTGQCVALGTMSGDVLVYDLRVLNSPLATRHAHEGPVHDLKIQPCPQHANKPRHSGRPSTKSGVLAQTHPHKSDFAKPTAKESSSTKSVRLNVEEGNERSYSPSLELLSPVKRGNKDCIAPKSTPLLKNLSKTPARLSKKDANWFDDLGILSPLDKENKSPSPLREEIISPPRKGSRSFKHAPAAVEGFLSPLRTSPTPLSEKSDSLIDPDASFVSPLTDGRPPLIDGFLSPVRTGGVGGGGEGGETEGSNGGSEGSPHYTEEGKGEKSGGAKPFEKDSVERVTRKSILREEACPSPHLESSVVEEGKGSSCTTEDPSFAFASDTAAFDPAPLGRQSEEEGKNEAFEIAFPLVQKEESPHGRLGPTSEKEGQRGNPAGDPQTLNLSLVQSCVSEALERHQFDVNKRFMHLHYSMLKHFLKMKEEMKQMTREASLNEELLTEVERLREENKRLRTTF